MKSILSILLAAVIVTPLSAQEPDCWHYENGDAPIVGSEDTPGSAIDIAVSGNYAFIVDGDSGLRVIDISNPETPHIIGSVNTPGWARGVAVQESHVYVADSSLQVIDIAYPESPQIVGSVDTPGSAEDVAIEGNYAYVAWRQVGIPAYGGLQVINITLPTSPQTVGSLPVGRKLQRLVVSGNYVYVLGHRNPGFNEYYYLLVIDISDPQDPIVIWQLELGYVNYIDITRVFDLTVSCDYLFVTVLGDLRIFDISDPSNPWLVGSLETPGYNNCVAVVGSFAYLAEAEDFFYIDGGLQVVDISVPESPTAVGWMDLPECSYGIDVDEQWVYIASGEAGLHIAWQQCAEAIVVDIDVKPGSDTNPINCRSSNGIIPVTILTTDLFDATTIDHTTVRFGPDEAVEVHENPHGPVRHEEDVDDDGDIDLLFHFRFSETGIQCGDTEATLTGATYNGLAFSGTAQIRTISGERNDEILALAPQISPNPFNPQTTISFAVDRLQQIRIAVYDLVGRQVAILTDQASKPGAYSLTWEGTDKSGRAVSSGTYIVRLETDSRVEARKEMLVR